MPSPHCPEIPLVSSMFSFLLLVLVFVCLHGVFSDSSSCHHHQNFLFGPLSWGRPLQKPSSCWSCGRGPVLFFSVPIGSPRARVFRSKTVLCNSFQQSNNPPLQRSSSLIQLTSQNSSPNQQRAPQVIGVMQSQNSSAGNRGPRPLEQVTCYKVSPWGRGGGHWGTGQGLQLVVIPSLLGCVVIVEHCWFEE